MIFPNLFQVSTSEYEVGSYLLVLVSTSTPYIKYKGVLTTHLQSVKSLFAPDAGEYEFCPSNNLLRTHLEFFSQPGHPVFCQHGDHQRTIPSVSRSYGFSRTLWRTA